MFRKWLGQSLCFIGWILFSLRYRVEIRGWDKLDRTQFKKGRGILILPNHPAYLDPLFVSMILWPKFHMKPLVIEYVYRHFGLRTFMKLARALPIPNFETSVNEFKLKKAQEVIEEIGKGLRKGENFLLYPSGRLKQTGKEILGGASAAHGILQECPETEVILVRTTGLWGSMFSRALIGRSPDIGQNLKESFKIIFKNLIFFAPRRKIVIEIEPQPKNFPRNASRVEFNRYLENWYNQYIAEEDKRVETEPLSLVSYSFWKKEYPEVYRVKKKQKDVVEGDISKETVSSVKKEVAKLAECPEEEVEPRKNLALDLGIDSLGIAQIVAFLTDHFDVTEVHPEDLETVQDVLNFAEMEVKSNKENKPASHYKWPEEKFRFPPEIPSGKTVHEAFLRSCDRMGHSPACGDDMIGVMSYAKLKRTALVLSYEIRKMEGKYIGILLPASSAAYLLIFAVLLSGKTPVMLNWTIGSRYLKEMVKQTSVKVILSSWKFLERLSYVEFGDLTDQFKLLEDIKKDLPFSSKIKGLLQSYRSFYPILRSLKLHKNSEDKTAVILFTSGTEALPKGVPLSHKNILSNQGAAMQCVPLYETDVIYGILPPFHSFGFSVAGIFPILCGIKVAYYPDPTDSFALVEGTQRWGITMFFSAPSFLKGVLSVGNKQTLKSVRLFVSGAEKTPQELYDKVAKLGHDKKLLEGYGITECAPILSINRVNLPPQGVGYPLPGVEFCTIHPETQKPLRYGEEGELCVRGPNVFKGYLIQKKSPFIEIHGKSYYCTGDLGYINENGGVVLSGRLKRFVKIGGEMISLGAMEEVLSEHLSKKLGAEGPCLAVCADMAERPNLILFTILQVDKQEVNTILKEAGFSRIVKISEIKKLEEFPLTGTGKTDYRTLQEMV